MNVEVAFSGSVKSVEALARFLKHLEVLFPQPVQVPKVIMADDGVVYVKARFATEEEAWSAGEKMAEGVLTLSKRLMSWWPWLRLRVDVRRALALC